MTLPRGRKLLKILRRASFNNKKKNSAESPLANGGEETLRRTPRKSQQAINLEELQRLHKELRSAAKYFCLIIDKMPIDIIMAKIPDNAAIVLDSVISIDDVLSSCVKLHKVKMDLMPYRKAVHKAVGDLIKWTDQLLVRGNVKGEDRKSVV